MHFLWKKKFVHKIDTPSLESLNRALQNASAFFVILTLRICLITKLEVTRKIIAFYEKLED